MKINPVRRSISRRKYWTWWFPARQKSRDINANRLDGLNAGREKDVIFSPANEGENRQIVLNLASPNIPAHCIVHTAHEHVVGLSRYLGSGHLARTNPPDRPDCPLDRQRVQEVHEPVEIV